MAIVIEGAPQRIHTTYNPVKYYFDETDLALKNSTGFRYIVDLYVYYNATATASFLSRYKVAPRPGDGIGYIDITQPLCDLVSYNFDPTTTGGYDATNCYIRYDLAIGRNVVKTYAFTAVQPVALIYPGQLKYTVPGHPFVAGDQIIIDAVDNITDGLYSVVRVTATEVFIEYDWYFTFPTTTGTITYADRRSDLIFGHTFSNITAYNAAESFKDFPDYTYLDFGLFNNLNTDRYALTNMPNNFTVAPSQDLWLNWLKDKFDLATQYIRIENSNGDVFRKTLWTNLPGVSGDVQQVGLGPNNMGTLTVLSGTLPLIKADTEWYEFKTFTTGFTSTSRVYRINIDRRCKIYDYEIAFLDRRGSICSFAFQLKDKISISAKRDSYNKTLGDLDTTANKYSYKTYGHGKYVYNVETDVTYTLNTNWMTEENSQYFEELFTSPATWLKIDGEYFSCQIEDNATEREKQRNKKLIRKTINVKLSNSEIINI